MLNDMGRGQACYRGDNAVFRCGYGGFSDECVCTPIAQGSNADRDLG